MYSGYHFSVGCVSYKYLSPAGGLSSHFFNFFLINRSS